MLVHYGERTLDTFAILDDGSERTMLLPSAAKSLGIQCTPGSLPLRTNRQDIQVLHGHTVSFRVSPAAHPQTSYSIEGAFTAGRLSIAQHTYSIDHLQRKFKHRCGIPIPALREAKPSLLIGSDQPHLITHLWNSQTWPTWWPGRSPHHAGVDPSRPHPTHRAASPICPVPVHLISATDRQAMQARRKALASRHCTSPA